MVLGALAAAGWASVFVGLSGVVVGVVGALAGVLVAWLSSALRLSPVATFALLLGGFVLFSGPAVPDGSITGFLPGPQVPPMLLGGLVDGWSDLVTTAAPVGLELGLGVVPYTCGVLAGFGAMILARRTRLSLVPAAPPLVAVGASILFGRVAAANVLVQGGGFAVVAVGWASVRANRPRRSLDGEIYWPRITGGAVMLGIITMVAVVVGPNLPAVESTNRTVLREEVIPPFDPRNYPSPLASLRAYRTNPDARDRTYFVADGVRKGDRIRLATMDTYDGVVWSVSAQKVSGGGRFERVGAEILPVGAEILRVPDWPARHIVVDVKAYTGVWVPTMGATRRARFRGPSADGVQQAFRYNRATGTGATPNPLRSGMTVDIDSRVAPQPDEAKAGRAKPGTTSSAIDPELAAVMDDISKAIVQFTAGAETPFAKAKMMEKRLRAGYFSDSLEDASGPASVPAGHSIQRLTEFLEVERPIGNDEQYAAAMAVMADLSGLPARVVMGIVPDRTGDRVAIKGRNFRAWVEINFAELGWVEFYPTPPDTEIPKEQPKKREEVVIRNQPQPPPPRLDVPETIPESTKRNKKEPPKPPKQEDTPDGLPAWVGLVATYVGIPLAVVLALIAAIVGLKALRRRRRRTRGTAVDQISGAWLEILDRLRDIGHWPRPSSTRLEVAATAADDGLWAAGERFATDVDTHMFGPAEPDAAAVKAVWGSLGQHIASLNSALSTGERVRAAVSLSSLRPSKHRSGRTRRRRPATGPARAPSDRDRLPVSAGPIEGQVLQISASAAAPPATLHASTSQPTTSSPGVKGSLSSSLDSPRQANGGSPDGPRANTQWPSGPPTSGPTNPVEEDN